MKQKRCEKKREKKNAIELCVTEMTVKYLKDKDRINKVAEVILQQHEDKDTANELKSVAVKIANIKKQVSDLTDTYVVAVTSKNKILQTSCEQKANDLQAQLNALEDAYSQLKRAEKSKLTKEQIIEYIDLFLNGDVQDKQFQKQVIDNLVNLVYVYDDKIVVYFNIRGSNEAAEIELDETNQAAEEVLGCSNSLTLGSPNSLLKGN